MGAEAALIAAEVATDEVVGAGLVAAEAEAGAEIAVESSSGIRHFKSAWHLGPDYALGSYAKLGASQRSTVATSIPLRRA